MWRLLCGKCERIFWGQNLFTRDDACKDRYVALCCTGLAESGDLVRGLFVVMTTQLSS